MKRPILLALAIISSFTTFSQLSGNYTVGGNSPDYADIKSAINALVIGGVSGEVHFKIRTGTYNEQNSVWAFSGGSENSRVYFESETGNKEDVTIEFNTSKLNQTNYVMDVMGGDFVTFRNLTFIGKGDEGGRVINIHNGTTNLTIENCHIEGKEVPSSYGASYALINSDWSLSPFLDSNVVIKNCVLKNGSYGIYMKGPSDGRLEANTVIEGNTLTNNSNFGLYLHKQKNLKVKNNTIISNSAKTGIRLESAAEGAIISSNTVTLTANASSSRGLYVNNCDGVSGNPIKIMNNMFATEAGASSYGFLMSSSAFVKVLGNSFRFESSETTSYGVYTSYTNDSITYYNNIFATYGGAKGAFFSSISKVFQACDFNNYYSTTGLPVNYINADISFGDWHNHGLDFSGTALDPHFVSKTDLHVCTSDFHEAGKSIAELSTDIDGQQRVGLPTIGADQLSGPMPKSTITLSNDTLKTNSANSYAWFKDGVALNGASDMNFVPSENGNYTVVRTMENGCTDTSAVYQILTTGIQAQEQKVLSVFPNPTSGIVTIGTGEQLGVRVFDLTGKTVMHQAQVTGSMDLSSLRKGIYMLQITDAKGQSTLERIHKK